MGCPRNDVTSADFLGAIILYLLTIEYRKPVLPDLCGEKSGLDPWVVPRLKTRKRARPG